MEFRLGMTGMSCLWSMRNFDLVWYEWYEWYDWKEEYEVFGLKSQYHGGPRLSFVLKYQVVVYFGMGGMRSMRV